MDKRILTPRWLSARSVAVLILVAVVCLILLASWLPPRETFIVVEENSLNFGEVWSSPDFQWELKIFNPSRRDVEVRRFLTGCRCGEAVPESLVIPKGKAASVQLHLDLTRRESERRTVREKDFEVDIVPEFTDRSVQRASWVLRGKVRYRFLVDPPGISFAGANEIRRGSTVPTSTIIVEPTESDLIVKAHVDSQAGNVETVLTNSGKFLVTFQPKQDLPIGPFSTQIDIKGVDSRGDAVAQMEIPVDGYVAPAIIAIPSCLHLGNGTVGSRLESIVSLQGTKHLKPAFVRATSQQDGVTVQVLDGPQPLVDVVRCQVVVEIEREGHQAFTIAFAIEDDHGSHTTLEVPGSYFGMRRPSCVGKGEL